MKKKIVLVTGATGRTGSLVVKKLRTGEYGWEVRGFARSRSKVEEIFGDTNGFFYGDILNPQDIAKALEGCQALVILTSAIPKMVKPAMGDNPPQFEFEERGRPEIVDWLGQKNQIDEAVRAKVEHVILVSSMGGTVPDHPLNRIGNGNILVWKKKAEKYLVASGLNYTIIRPGGLLDAPEGKRELLTGKNDEFLKSPPPGVSPSIPRGDLANVIVQALNNPYARNKAFDLISKPENFPGAVVTTDWYAFFAATGPAEVD